MKTNVAAFLFVVMGMLAAVPSTTQTVFHVAVTGNDSNPGTARKPFASLERARTAIRATHGRPHRMVLIHPGAYELKGSLELDERDSGTAVDPIVWKAAPHAIVRITGGRTLPLSEFHAVTSDPATARLDRLAVPHVLAVDLIAAGIPASAPFPAAYHGAPPGPELFFNDRRMKIARWPNRGWSTIDHIVEQGSVPRDGDSSNHPGIFAFSGDRPLRWKASEGVWLQGYWCFDWYDQVIQVGAINRADRTITLAQPHVYGLRKGNPSPRRWRALNLLEELDEPGEFYIDRITNRLYFWPPKDTIATDARLTLSTLNSPIIVLKGATGVSIEGITVECGLDNGVEITGGSNCTLNRCIVRNIRLLGVRISGGEHHRVLNCDLHDTGTGALILEGGDRRTLMPAHHEAVNNHIWNFSIHQQTSAYGLILAGVGNRASNNLIHDAPHQAVFISGNDHVFEYNEVHHVCTETDECGALYKGRNPSCRGNLIQYNYFHEIGSPMGHGNAAIYFDDGDGGDYVICNVFFRCGDPGNGPFGTVFSHGGHGITATNNLFVECKRAFGSAPWNDARWLAALNGGEDCFFPDKLLKEVDITQPPYSIHYPELAGYMHPIPGVPRISVADLNLLIGCDQVSNGNWKCSGTLNLNGSDDTGLVNRVGGSFRLRRNAPVYAWLKGFKPIPFEKIGLLDKRSGHSSRVQVAIKR